MYAVIATGGKQRRVQLGCRYQIERIPTALDEKVVFEDVLLLNDDQKVHIGTPQVTGASVEAVVVDHARGPKIRIIKMRRRKHSMTKTGHRQQYTWVRITRIGSASEAAPSQNKKADTAKTNETKAQAKPVKKSTRTTARKTAPSVEKKPVSAQKTAKTSSNKSKADNTETPRDA